MAWGYLPSGALEQHKGIGEHICWEAIAVGVDL